MRSVVGLVLVGLLSSAAQQSTRERDAALTSGGSGVITGRVEIHNDPNHTPVRHGIVAVSLRDGERSSATQTDNDGRFRIEGLATGTYDLRIAKEGFVAISNEATVVDVKPGAATVVAVPVQRAGALEGRFMNERGEPISGLFVSAERVTGTRPPAGEKSVTVSYSATTDDRGQYRIYTLPPGRYRVYATPPPPASGERLFFPGTSNPSEATVLTVQSGQTISGLDLTAATAPLSPLAATALSSYDADTRQPAAPGATARVSGRVTRLDTHQPLANVQLQMESRLGGRRRTTTSDDDGRFEFADLLPDQYYVSASLKGFVRSSGNMTMLGGNPIVVTIKDQEAFDRANIELVPSSAIECRVFDEFGDPAPAVVVRIARSAFRFGTTMFLPVAPDWTTGMTDDRGWIRIAGLSPGDYYAIAVPAPFAQSRPTGFTVTYFPGTPSADAAVPIHVVAGMDANNVMLRLAPSASVNVTGVVTDASGAPVPNAAINLFSADDGAIRSDRMARVTADSDGRVVIRDLPEGSYVIQSGTKTEFGSVSLNVSATRPDSAAFALRLLPVPAIRGRVVFEGAPAPSPQTANIFIVFEQAEYAIGPGTGLRPTPTITDDWHFELSGVAARGLLRVITPEPWAVARVRIQGRDITDTPYDFQLADAGEVEVTLTTRVGTVSGIVQDGGRAAARMNVVVFGANDSTMWQLARTLHGAQTAADGSFTIRGLLPGRYVAIAVPEQSLSDPSQLFALRPRATPVTVTEGADTPVKLTVVK